MARPAVHESVPQAEATLEMWMPILWGLQSWNGRCAEKAAAMSREWVEFMGRRLKEDFALPVHLAACKGPEDVWRTYSDFLRRMGDDYQGEMAELTRLGQALIAETMEHIPADRRDREAA